MHVCKHGLPASWSIEAPDGSVDHTFRQHIKVTMCRQCVEDGTAKAVALEIERMMRRDIERRLAGKAGP